MITAIVSRDDGDDRYTIQVVCNEAVFNFSTSCIEIVPCVFGRNELLFDDKDVDKKVILIDKLIMA